MSTLRSVPVRRIIISQQQQQQQSAPSTSASSSTVYGARPATPRMFRDLASQVAPLERTASNTSNNNNNLSQKSTANNTPKSANLEPITITTSAAAADQQGTQPPTPHNNNNNNNATVPPSTTTATSVHFNTKDQSQQRSVSTSSNANNNSPSRSAVVTAPTHINITNFEQLPAIRGVLNSPRSLKACQSLKIHPTELVPRPLIDFIAHGCRRTVAVLRRDHFEKQRQEKIAAVRQCRESMPPPPEYNNGATNSASSSAVLGGAVGQKGSNGKVSSSGSFARGNTNSNNNIRSSSANQNTNNSNLRSGTPTNSRSGSAAQQQQRPRSPMVRSNTPLSRNNTTTSLARSATNTSAFVRQNSSASIPRKNNYNDTKEHSPARDDHLRRAAEREQHRQEISSRARMEQETKDMQNAKKLAYDERKHEVAMRKMLRDRLVLTEKKRLDLEDNMARAQRQRRLREQETERQRVIAAQQKAGPRHRDPYQVAQAKQMYSSPAQRRNFVRSASAADSRSASAVVY